MAVLSFLEKEMLMLLIKIMQSYLFILVLLVFASYFVALLFGGTRLGVP